MNVIAVFPIFIVLTVVIFLPFIIGVYVYRDASRRGMNAILWAFVAALVPSLIGLLIYLLVRGNYSDLRCPGCDTPVNEQFVVCPKCGAKLRPFCPNCATPVEPDWKLCPKCTQPLPEYQTDIYTPVKTKDRSIWKVLAIVLIIPILLIALLILFMRVSFSGGSISVREVTISEYYEEMTRDGKTEIAEEVKDWAEDVDLRIRSAYALQYTYASEAGNQHFFLVYVPSVGKQTHTVIGQSSRIFGMTLTLDLGSPNGQEGALFNIVSSADKAPNLKIKVDGKKIPCEVTTVDYNPTLYYIVPQYLDPSPAGFFMPERITVVKIVNNHNEGSAEIIYEDMAIDILVGIDSAPYLDREHDIYRKPDGSGGYDFKDGFDIIIEYKVHDDMVLHEDMLHCLVLEQNGGYYIIDDRDDNGRNIRETDEAFYNKLSSLFQ